MNTGELIGKTYLIPQYQDQQATQQMGIGGQGAPMNDDLKALDGLQYVQNQTSDYYRKVAALKSFMQDVHNNLGIDVRVPDHTKGEMGIKLNELYNYALADIMAQGNLLKNSHGTMSNLVNQHARFTTDPTSRPADQMVYGQDYNFQNPSQFVKEKNDQIKALYDQGDYEQAKKLHAEAKAYLEEQGTANPQLAPLFKTDLMALEPPRKGVMRPANSYQERAYGRKVDSAGRLVDDIVFLSNGARDSFTPDTTKLNEKGNPMLVSKEFSGWKFGDSVLKGWQMNPDTDKVELLLANGQKIDASEDSGSIIRTLLSSNQNRTGIDISHLEEYLDKNKLQDEYSQVNQPEVMTRRSKNWKILQQKNKDSALKVGETVTKQAVQQLSTDLDKLEEPGWFTDGEDKQIGPYVVHRAKEGYSIKNLTDVHPPINFKNNNEAKAFYSSFNKFKSKEELIKFLQKQNAHVDYLKANTPTEITPEQMQPTGGTGFDPTKF